MFYNPRNKNVISIKCRAMAAESLESYVQTRTTNSATESLDDPATEKKALDDVNLYVASVAFSAIDDAKIFFSSDPKKAYDEFVALLGTSAVRDKVLAYLEQQRVYQADFPFEDKEDRERTAQLARYESARRKVDGLAAESLQAKRELSYMKSSINKKYPDLIPEEE